MFRSVKFSRILVLRSALVAIAAVVVGAVLVFAGGARTASANSAVSAAALPKPSGSASSVPALQKLQTFAPKLDLADAVQVLSNSTGTVWLTRSTSGETCLIEAPVNDASGVGARFGCRDEAIAATEGIVAGVPGHWYGVVPENSAQNPSATVNGKTEVLTVTNSAFWVPAEATSVTVGGQTVELPSGK
jgi:hypothetical protein